MAKFGRFEFAKGKPAETYEGEYMDLDRDTSAFSKTGPTDKGHLVAAIHLDKGQSVRETKQ